MPYLSASEVMFHEQALYQVYVPLPLQRINRWWRDDGLTVYTSVVRHAAGAHNASAAAAVGAGVTEARHLRAWRHRQLRPAAEAETRLPSGSPAGRQNHRRLDHHRRNEYRLLTNCRNQLIVTTHQCFDPVSCVIMGKGIWPITSCVGGRQARICPRPLQWTFDF